MELMTREMLYDLVWSEPVRDLAERLGITDVGLAKQCRRANVPVPPRGYWAKLDAGKKVERTPLPPKGPTQSGIVGVGRAGGATKSHLTPEETVVVEGRKLEEPVFEEALEAARERIAASVKRVTIPSLRRTQHPAIARLLEREEQSFQAHGWRYLQFDSRLEKRRLRLLNALFIALERHGAKPVIRGERAREVEVEVGHAVVTLQIDTPRTFRRQGRAPADPLRLELRLGAKGQVGADLGVWEEKKVRLDEQLREVVVGVLVGGEVLRREAAIRRYREELEYRAAQAREEQRRQERLEQERVERLLKEAAARRQAEDVRSLVAAARSAGVIPATGCDGSLEEWACWATAVADRLDPLVRPESKEPGTPPGPVTLRAS